MRSSLLLAALTLVSALLPATELPANFLVAKDYQIQTPDGRLVVLRGPNLGGWLMLESWMCPTGSIREPGPPAPDGTEDTMTLQRHVDALLRQRFGIETKNRLLDAYRAAWITTTDLDHLPTLGMNFVRVPFSYLSFWETQPADVPLDRLVWKPEAEAFKHLDWVINECAKRGIYVLLDLHEVEGPTAQGTPTGPESFWKVPAYQDRMVELWRRIAARYRGNPTVAGYDLLNEPWSTPIDLYDRCYRAIREIDPDHIIFVETWEYGRMPSPFVEGAWTNVVCSLHLYNKSYDDLQATLDQVVVPLTTNKAQEGGGRGIPIHVGEFHIAADEAHKDAAWLLAIQTFADHDVAWNNWTWKTVNQMSWSFINAQEAQPRPRVPDLKQDSAEAIAQAWSGWVTRPDHRIYDWTRNRLAAPVVTDDAFQTDAQGSFTFTVDTLIDNDDHLSAGSELSILEPETATPHGQISGKDGTWVYQANPGFSGTDRFTYILMDAKSRQAAVRPGVVTITVPKR